MKGGKNLANSIVSAIDDIVNFPVAYAHCDIPCGIYDPHTAQMAAHTVIRMVKLINDATAAAPKETPTPAQRQEFVSKIQRYTAVKEQHAELVKHEVRVLWGDYFKPEHAKANPGLHDLVWKTLKDASKARQEVSMDTAKELLKDTEQIAEIFWKTKSVETKRVKSFYPSEEEIVYPKV